MLDLALSFDPVTRRLDLVAEGGDWKLDATPVTPMIVSLGTDRRAEPDDSLPEALDEGAVTPAGRFDPRRGWSGDALDPERRRIGSRLWLLERAKHTDETLLEAVGYAEQAVAWMAGEGVPVTVDAAWLGRETLALRARAGAFSLTLPARGTDLPAGAA